jgi:hypothetical protein
MALTSSDTLVNTPRRRRSVVMSRKNLSTMFSHDAEVGVKCMLNRGCLASQTCTAGFTVSVALLALADDLGIEHVERGEQSGRAIALVVVRHGGRTALLERQSRLRAIGRLHLALLVAAQHQRVLGRRHVQAHDVFELLDKQRIARDLEAVNEMRLQAIGAPVPRDPGSGVII